MEQNDQELTNEELALIEVIIKNRFASNMQLAEITGLDRRTIAKIKSRPHVDARIKDFTMSNIERFQDLTEKALEVAEVLMDNSDAQTAWNAAKPFVESLKTNKVDLDAKVQVIPPINISFTNEP